MADISTKRGALALFALLELDAIVAKLSDRMRQALLGDPHPAPVTAHALDRRGLLAEGWRRARLGRPLPLSETGEAVAAFLRQSDAPSCPKCNTRCNVTSRLRAECPACGTILTGVKR